MVYKNYFANLIFIFFMVLSVAVYSSSPNDEENETAETSVYPTIKSERNPKVSGSIARLQNSTRQTPLQLLRANAQALEEKENFLAAAQVMDRVLKLTKTPSLADLCYALDLNHKAPLAKNRQNRPQQIATQISQSLRVNPNAASLIFQTASKALLWRTGYLEEEH